jgi:hypothetical protein
VGLEGFGPGEIALARFLVASAVLAGYTAVVRLRLSERRDLPMVLVSGFLAFALNHVDYDQGRT